MALQLHTPRGNDLAFGGRVKVSPGPRTGGEGHRGRLALFTYSALPSFRISGGYRSDVCVG